MTPEEEAGLDAAQIQIINAIRKSPSLAQRIIGMVLEASVEKAGTKDGVAELVKGVGLKLPE